MLARASVRYEELEFKKGFAYERPGKAPAPCVACGGEQWTKPVS